VKQSYDAVVWQNISVDIVYDDKIRNPKVAYFSRAMDFYHFHPSSHEYLPVVQADSLWNLEANQIVLDFEHNNSISLNFKFYLRPVWVWCRKFDILTKALPDELKLGLSVPAPHLLILSVAVQIMHAALGTIGFIIAIMWWKSRDNAAAISLQAVVIETISQYIILLYLIVQSTDTASIVSQGMNILYTLWKMSKLTESVPGFPYIGAKESYRRETMRFDMEGYKFVGLAMIPIAIAYAVYSFLHGSYETFSRFLREASLDGVFAFGCLAMVPQLYINFRLKTVAGMSGPLVVCQFLDAFIDDLWLVYMKFRGINANRIADFRYVIIFVVWLWQRKIYREDPNRVTEFGVSVDETGGIIESQQARDAEDEKGKVKEGDDSVVVHRAPTVVSQKEKTD
jgi:hypothetical protein